MGTLRLSEFYFMHYSETVAKRSLSIWTGFDVLVY